MHEILIIGICSQDAEGAVVGFEGARLAAFASYDDAQRVWMRAWKRGQILGFF